MQRIILASPLLTLFVACANQPPAPGTQVPESLRPAATEAALATLAARGVQVYECRAKKDAPGASEWAFVAPEADLIDSQGARVGKHYAGPHWESMDGSKLLGTVKARAEAPQSGAIPWLLLTTKPVGPNGKFAKVSSIQRINTVGGVAPAADECTPAVLGKEARVAYTADYVMFETK